MGGLRALPPTSAEENISGLDFFVHSNYPIRFSSVLLCGAGKTWRKIFKRSL
jgi:hypothetical protein